MSPRFGVVYHRCIFRLWELPLLKHVMIADSTSKSHFRPELCSDMHLANNSRSLNWRNHYSIQNLIRKFPPSKVSHDDLIASIVSQTLFITSTLHFITGHLVWNRHWSMIAWWDIWGFDIDSFHQICTLKKTCHKQLTKIPTAICVSSLDLGRIHKVYCLCWCRKWTKRKRKNASVLWCVC